MQTSLQKWVSFRKKALSPLFRLGGTKQTKQRSQRRCDLGSIPFEPWRQQPEQIGLLCAAWQQAPNDRLSIWTAWSHTLVCSCLWAALLDTVHARWLHVWCPTSGKSEALHPLTSTKLTRNNCCCCCCCCRCQDAIPKCRVSMRQRHKGISKGLQRACALTCCTIRQC